MAVNLASVTRGRRLRAPKIIIYGGPKIGKSTFASCAPKAIVIATEEGLDDIDVAHFPLAKSYQEVIDAIASLATEEHDYSTVVLDSLDWLEPLIWQHLCKQHNCETIEQVGGGYGKGYTEAAKLWRELIEGLDYLRNERDMAIVLIAHDETKRIDPPDGEPYNYASLKLHAKAAAIATEWADIIGYAHEPRIVKKDDVGFNKKHARAVSSKKRQLFLGKHPAYMTGSRFDLPETVPLEWEEFAKALAAATASGTAASNVRNTATNNTEKE